MRRFVQVSTTFANRRDATGVARALVDRRLAACVQVIGPIESVYRWQGRVESAREWLCLVKTTRAHYPRLAAAVRELHPYETPELVAVPIAAGSRGYLDWLSSSVSSSGLPRSRQSSIVGRRSRRRSSCRSAS
jgi:periplasmic divalent cation tolerance protein